MKVRWLLFLAALLSALALLSACSDDDDDEGDEGGAATTAAAESTDEEDDEPGEEAEPASDEEEGEDDDSAGSADHACSLLTAQEVSQAVGFEVLDGGDYLAANPDATQCEWPAPEEGGSVFAEILTEGGEDYYDAVTFGLDDPDSPVEVQQVEGIGDEALLDDIGVLQVVDGDNYVSVQIVVFGSEVDELTAARGLADAILAKLP